MQSTDLASELRNLLEQQSVVPVVGAGISIATAGAPGWKDLLTSGIKHLNTRHLLSAAVESELDRYLRENQLTRVAELLQRQMGAPGGEYAAWLRSEFDDRKWEIRDTSLIVEILDLPCPLITTTNYDHLLERLDANLRRTAVQTDPTTILSSLRDGGIFHLHGTYDDATSVVLSASDYDKALANPAYRSAIQAIWLTKSLLFIGCSFDGITDPDFTQLFDWAASTFGPSPHRHYALVLNQSANSGASQHYLLGKFRLQLVPFGDRHSDLARFIANINPDRSKARRRRANHVSALLASPSVIDHESFQHTLGPWIPPDKIAALEADAQVARERRLYHVNNNRATLATAKAIFENLPEKDAILDLHKNWKPSSAYTTTIHQTCLAALTAISTVPRDFLDELNRRDGAHIPATVANGMSQQHLLLLDALPAGEQPSFMEGDDYGAELLERLLRTFVIILELNTDAIFPLPTSGARVALRGTFIAIGSTKGVTIVDTSSFNTAAFLQTDARVQDLAEIEYKGTSAILVLMGDRWLIWDPRRSGLPLADVPIPPQYFATHILPQFATTPEMLSIRVQTNELIRFSGGAIFETIELTAPLTSFAKVGGDVYGITPKGDLFHIKDSGTCLPAIEREALIKQILDSHKQSKIIDGKLSNIAERIRLFMQHAYIHSGRIDGEDALGISVRFDLGPDGNSAVFLWRPTTGFTGFWRIEGRAIRLKIFSDAKGPGLLVSLLSHFRENEPLMLWARPQLDATSPQFHTVQKAAFIQEDLYCLHPVEGAAWFAADTTGRSFRIESDGTTAPLYANVGVGGYASVPLKW